MGGVCHFKLKKHMLRPEFFPNTNCYTIFGDGQTVTFENKDNSKIIQKILSKKKVYFTGTKGSDRLYHLDTPQSTEHSYLTTQSPMQCLILSCYIIVLST
jgi:hypothetical protein